MRIADTMKITLGSVAVYYVMAACSAGSSSPWYGSSGSSSGSAAKPSSGSSSGGASTSSSGTGGTSSSSSPVPDANADESQGGSRLKANYFVGGDGSKQFAYFTDSQLGGVQCTFETASDGSTRCLPSGAYAGLYFSDSGCSTPAAYSTTCTTTPKYAYAYVNSGGCSEAAQVRIYPVTSAYAGDIYVGTPGACSVATISAADSYFALGSELPATTFQQANIQAE